MKKIMLVFVFLFVAGCATPVQEYTGEEVFYDYSVEENVFSFSVSVPAPTPCHALDYEVRKELNSIVLDVEIYDDTEEGQICIQVIDYQDINEEVEYLGEDAFMVYIDDALAVDTTIQ